MNQIISKRSVPLAGIVAFSLCSVGSIYHLLSEAARNPSPVLWGPAVLIELICAWAVYQIVEHGRLVTRSNISKQDRRFYAGILVAFVLVAGPLVGVSVWANTVEFGNLVLGFLFPVGSIGCAIGAALPTVTQRHRQAQADERQEKAKSRREKDKERQRKAEEKQRACRLAQKLGTSAPVFELYRANPTLSQAEAAQKLGISRQTVGYHLDKLEAEGVIVKGNGAGVEVL